MRGEDVASKIGGAMIRGSPPHARGRLLAVVPEIPEGRITPACAGKTAFDFADPDLPADHPRMRGEDLIGKVLRQALLGSPPHARGRLRAS